MCFKSFNTRTLLIKYKMAIQKLAESTDCMSVMSDLILITFKNKDSFISGVLFGVVYILQLLEIVALCFYVKQNV